MDSGSEPHPGKSQVAIGILKNNGTEPLDKQLDPSSPLAYRGRSVQPSVKYVADKKSCQEPSPAPDGIFWSCTCKYIFRREKKTLPIITFIYYTSPCQTKCDFLCACFCNATSDWITSKNLLFTVGNSLTS